MEQGRETIDKLPSMRAGILREEPILPGVSTIGASPDPSRDRGARGGGGSKISFGQRYRGRTFAEVYDTDKGYVQ